MSKGDSEELIIQAMNRPPSRTLVRRLERLERQMASLQSKMNLLISALHGWTLEAALGEERASDYMQMDILGIDEQGAGFDFGD